MRNDNVVFFPGSVKGEAAQPRFNTLLVTDTAVRACVFSIVSCANTNLSTMITAEKIADRDHRRTLAPLPV